MGRLAAVMVILIMNLAGCSNSGNPDAPTSKEAHEKTWVAYHRNDTLNALNAVFFSATAAVKPGLLNSEHVTQCHGCHGANLLGTKEDAVGPACLDCHVLDPIRYPVMCYSCHGYPVVTTQKWYSSNRAARPGLPLGSEFSNRVNSDNDSVVHLKHQTVPQSSSDFTADECAVCHGGKSSRGAKHHEIKDPITNNILNCFLCHVFTFDQPIGAPTFSIPKCSINTPQLTCHPSGK